MNEDPHKEQPLSPTRLRRRPDPIAGTWENEVVPLLKTASSLRPIDVIRQLSNRYPHINAGTRRTLERRIRQWRITNTASSDASRLPVRSTSEEAASAPATFSFLRAAHQGVLLQIDLPYDVKSHDSIRDILENCKSARLSQRNKAMLALALVCRLPLRHLVQYPVASSASLYRWKRIFEIFGFKALMRPISRERLRCQDPNLGKMIFRILHEPPSIHGFQRTNWRQIDLHTALKNSGTRVSIWTIRRVIRNNKYQWRKAKVVLTSNDPDYRAKVENIKRILACLAEDESFFSIDEYGPFTVRLMPGRKLCAPGEIPFVPQWQKSRGSLILTGALELKTNQITHFYSDGKNTAEMIKMVELLRRKHRGANKLYISWDAAGWHMSKALASRVEFLNQWASYDGAPALELAPLPSRAQFLNVIESVFSGMSRAVIQNSNFENVAETKEAIDRYFFSRNKFFTAHPKRAGRKIWMFEKCEAEFRDDNNCKDERYR
jgi:hypothetical protein